MKTPKWTFETEYQSAQKRQKTGWAVIRKDGQAIGRVYENAAAQMTAALNYYENELAHAGEPA